MTDEMICVEAVDAAKRLALREMQPGDVEALEDFCDMVTGLPPGTMVPAGEKLTTIIMNPPPPFKRYKGKGYTV